ncbi:SDR family NAD(P)-dependent oxidoreductase [Streptomyces iakyrus]|uniref:SDR family NAD(P)-dependent oxidoreductase n=1 Tax=Streptomyces iakyrus TaxID=68219 RepID=UPI0036879D7A
MTAQRTSSLTLPAVCPHAVRLEKRNPRMPSKLTGTVALVTGASSGIGAATGCGVYNVTKFGVHAFTESLRQEVTERHVRVGVLEPGAVESELGTHNKPEVRDA